MSNRIAPAVFQSDNETKVPLAELRSAGLIQSPWFGFGIAAFFVAPALEIGAHRVWLFGIAGIAVALGLIDWIGGPQRD